MTSRISRLVLLSAVLAIPAFGGDELKKCNADARECQQEIRNMMAGRRYLGASVVDLNPGVEVKSVAADGPAARGGLREGDRIVAVNGQYTIYGDTRQFKQAMAESAKSTKILSVIIQRRGTLKRLEIRLEPLTKEQIDKIVAAHVAQSHNGVAGSQP